jgi:hypothetical protein
MDIMLKLTILCLGVAFDIAVFFLLVKRRINERASLPWIAGSFIIMLFSLMPSLLEVMTDALGISYPPAFLFLIAILIILLLLLYQSIHISMLQNKCQELAQHLAIISSMGNIERHARVVETKETEDTSFSTGSTGSTGLPLVRAENISLHQ